MTVSCDTSTDQDKRNYKEKRAFSYQSCKPFFLFWCRRGESNSQDHKGRGILSPKKPFIVSPSTSCKTCQISIINGIDESWHVGWSQVESGQNSTPRAQFRHKKGVACHEVLPLFVWCSRYQNYPTRKNSNNFIAPPPHPPTDFCSCRL